MTHTPVDANLMFYRPRDARLIEWSGIEIADEGYWGLKCDEGHRAPRTLPNKWHRDRYACEVQHQYARHAEELLILPDAVVFIDNRNAVLDVEWFHDTESGDLTREHVGVTHLGTCEAAADRQIFNRDFRRVESTTYRVQIDRNAIVHERVLVEPAAGEHGHEHFEEWFENADVIRYVNAHEAPGSISLAVKPDILILAS